MWRNKLSKSRLHRYIRSQTSWQHIKIESIVRRSFTPLDACFRTVGWPPSSVTRCAITLPMKVKDKWRTDMTPLQHYISMSWTALPIWQRIEFKMSIIFLSTEFWTPHISDLLACSEPTSALRSPGNHDLLSDARVWRTKHSEQLLVLITDPEQTSRTCTVCLYTLLFKIRKLLVRCRY